MQYGDPHWQDGVAIAKEVDRDIGAILGWVKPLTAVKDDLAGRIAKATALLGPLQKQEEALKGAIVEKEQRLTELDQSLTERQQHTTQAIQALKDQQRQQQAALQEEWTREETAHHARLEALTEEWEGTRATIREQMQAQQRELQEAGNAHALEMERMQKEESAAKARLAEVTAQLDALIERARGGR